MADIINEKEMNLLLSEYWDNEIEMKKRKKRMDEIKKVAKSYLAENGVPDTTGKSTLILDNGKLQNIVRESASLNNERGVEFFRAIGHNDCLNEITIFELDEEKIEEKVRNGDITVEDLNSIMDRKTNNAFYIKRP